MKLLAPAKINLSLLVRGKRADGFHEIESLMTPISLADELEIAVSERAGVEFSCSDATLPVGGDNLVVRAAELFLRESGIANRKKIGVRIHLEKRIPHGAGLGGGSSDAASTLLGLNALFSANYERSRLAEWAAQLGSDVPFFIAESAAICRGRGEIVEPMAVSEKIPKLPLLLLKPSFGVPTPWAYSRWKDSREIPGVPYAAQKFSWGELVNDLERPVFEKYIFLAAVKRWLLAQPEVAGALMSGSGSTSLAVLREAANGELLAERAREEFGSDLWTCVCETR